MKEIRNGRNKKLDQDTNKALAVLIASTKIKKRPISLLDISKWLDVAVKKLDGYRETADRIGLSTKMLRQFSLVKRLHPKVQRLFEYRALDSIDAVIHLLLLPRQEQIVLANLLAAKKIDTKDLRAVVQIRKEDKNKSIKNIVNEVVNSKTKKQYVVEFIIREGYNHIKLMNKFKKYIAPSEIVRLEIDGSFGRLILTKDGKEELYRVAKNLGTHLQSVIPVILSR